MIGRAWHAWTSSTSMAPMAVHLTRGWPSTFPGMAFQGGALHRAGPAGARGGKRAAPSFRRRGSSDPGDRRLGDRRGTCLDMAGLTRPHMADPADRGQARCAVTRHRIRPCVGAGYCIDRIYGGQRCALPAQRLDRPRDAGCRTRWTAALDRPDARWRSSAAVRPAWKLRGWPAAARAIAVTLLRGGSTRLGGQVLLAAKGRMAQGHDRHRRLARRRSSRHFGADRAPEQAISDAGPREDAGRCPRRRRWWQPAASPMTSLPRERRRRAGRLTRLGPAVRAAVEPAAQTSCSMTRPAAHAALISTADWLAAKPASRRSRW